MLQTKNLVKIYKPKKGVPVTALNNVTLKFPEKGMVFLLGKSGSGKSTLLNVLGGLDNYNSGEIIIKGVSSKNFKQKHFDSYRNTYVGFIFQEYNIIEDFTVGANIALAIELQNRKAEDGEINRILKEVDLEGYGNRKPNELSGGQKQRVAIARALVKKPEIIMADEPTGALDSNTGKQVLDTLKKLSKEKLVIIVSHDREFAEAYADRIIELSDGSVISDVEVCDDALEKSEDRLEFNGTQIDIPVGYHITEADRKAINEYIEGIKNKSVKLNILGNGNFKNRFIKTDESKIRIKENSEFKLIKSKLPMKNAFKIGAGGLKYKKIRLVITILLSCVAFGLFGLADTFAAYNHINACTNSLYDTGVKYLATAKSKKVGEGVNAYWRDYGYGMSENDIKNLSENTGIAMQGVYVPLECDLSFSEQINPEVNLSETEFNIYRSEFSGFAEITPETVKNMDFKILSGVLPDGTKNEIAISEYIFEVFKSAGYSDLNSKEFLSITSYNDIIGKNLKIDGSDYTITAVVDTNFDLERYKDLLIKKDYQSDTDKLVDYVLYQEFLTSSAYSYTQIIMTGEGFVDNMLASRVKKAKITEGYISFFGEDFAADTNYIAKLSYINPEDIIWIGEPKSELGEKEIVVSKDSIYMWNDDDDIYKLLQNYPELESSEYRFGTMENKNESGYKVVGVIDTDNNEKMNSTLVCSDNLYNVFAEGEENYYQFAVGAAPDSKADLSNAVAYCYKEDGTVRYQIQNSVTYELDSINEILNSCSKIFVYIGIGFAIFAAAMLANFIGTSISYKKQEIGILRAIGSRSNDVFRIFFAESFIIAMINFVLSALGVFAITSVINYILRHKIGILITVLGFNIRQILLLFAVSLAVAFAASFLPVKKIASKRPIDAIRNR